MNVLFQSPLGALLAKPWVDQAGLFGLRRWYMPLSRLWAAANQAGTDAACSASRSARCRPSGPISLCAGCSAITTGCGRRARRRAQDGKPRSSIRAATPIPARSTAAGVLPRRAIS